MCRGSLPAIRLISLMVLIKLVCPAFHANKSTAHPSVNPTPHQQLQSAVSRGATVEKTLRHTNTHY